MKRFWRVLISVMAGSVAGFACYQIGGNLVYVIRGSARLATYDPLLVTSDLLALPATAAAALTVDYVLKRAFRSRKA